jgi:hypothetical protein
VGDFLPQLLEGCLGFEVGEHELGPARGRTRRGRPVCRALVEHLSALADIGKPIAAEQRGVDALERVGRHRTGETNPGAALLAERQHPITEPRGDEVERRGLGMERAGALEIEVEDRQVDVLGPLLVGDLGHRASQRLLARLGAERDDLARLDVGAEADNQLGQGADAVCVHGGIKIPGLRIPAGSSCPLTARRVAMPSEPISCPYHAR